MSLPQPARTSFFEHSLGSDYLFLFSSWNQRSIEMIYILLTWKSICDYDAFSWDLFLQHQDYSLFQKDLFES